MDTHCEDDDGTNIGNKPLIEDLLFEVFEEDAEPSKYYLKF